MLLFCFCSNAVLDKGFKRNAEKNAWITLLLPGLVHAHEVHVVGVCMH